MKKIILFFLFLCFIFLFGCVPSNNQSSQNDVNYTTPEDKKDSLKTK